MHGGLGSGCRLVMYGIDRIILRVAAAQKVAQSMRRCGDRRRSPVMIAYLLCFGVIHACRRVVAIVGFVQITRFLSGLVLAVDYQKGMVMIEERGYSEHEGFFQDVLEIARRHKIMNPEKMRTEYAKVGVGVEI